MATQTVTAIEDQEWGFGTILGASMDALTGTMNAAAGQGFTNIVGLAILQLVLQTPSSCFFTTDSEGEVIDPDEEDDDDPLDPVFPVIYGSQNLSDDIQMIRGDTHIFTFTVAYSQTGDPYDVTGCAFRMTAKWRLDDLDISSHFSCTSPLDGIEITSAIDGICQVTITPIKTSTLPPRNVILYYDVQMTTPSGQVFTVLIGRLRIRTDHSITTP